jgi:hypothetical protein
LLSAEHCLILAVPRVDDNATTWTFLFFFFFFLNISDTNDSSMLINRHKLQTENSGWVSLENTTMWIFEESGFKGLC